mgnify:CR=1 FL=1
MSICEEITFDSTSLPLRTTEAAVSSHELSIPNINTSCSIVNYLLMSLFPLLSVVCSPTQDTPFSFGILAAEKFFIYLHTFLLCFRQSSGNDRCTFPFIDRCVLDAACRLHYICRNRLFFLFVTFLFLCQALIHLLHALSLTSSNSASLQFTHLL